VYDNQRRAYQIPLYQAHQKRPPIKEVIANTVKDGKHDIFANFVVPGCVWSIL